MVDEVPDAGDDAVRDPNLGGLYAARLLPSWYQPAAMPTQVRGWRRVAAWTVVVMLLVVASAGVCLTFGEVLLNRTPPAWSTSSG